MVYSYHNMLFTIKFKEKKTMKKKLISIISMLLIMCLVLTGCGEDAGDDVIGGSTDTSDTEVDTTSDEKFVIGSFIPLSGDGAGATQLLQNSMELAAKYINETYGGIDGKEIEFLYYDTTSSSDEAAKLAVKLVEEDNIQYCIPSPMSTDIKASMETLTNAGVFTVVLGTSGSLLVDDNGDLADSADYIFRAALNANYSMPAFFDIIDDVDATKIAVIYSQEEVSVATKDSFVAELENHEGLELVAVESIDSSDSDFTAQISNVLEAEPDLIFTSVTGTTGVLWKQIRQMGYKNILIHKEVPSSEQIQIAGTGSEYLAFPTPYVTYTSIDDVTDEYMKWYLEMYEAEYGDLPTTDWGYRGWDAVMTMYYAAEAAGSSDPEAMKNAMDKVSFQGLGGTLDFTAGDHEGYKSFNAFITLDQKYYVVSDWLANGGLATYEEYIK